MCVARVDFEGAPLLQIIHLFLKSLVWRLSWTKRFFLSAKTLLQNMHSNNFGLVHSFRLVTKLEEHLLPFWVS